MVIVPYKRYKMFGRADIRMQLNRIFFAIAERHDFDLKSLEILEEHLHLFIKIRPSQSIAKVMQYLKGGSSYELRKLFPELDAYHRYRLWSKGKFFRPIGEVNEETVKHYIEDSQSKHHKEIRKLGAWLQEESLSQKTPQTTLLSFTS